jgi:hypothetical protein
MLIELNHPVESKTWIRNELKKSRLIYKFSNLKLGLIRALIGHLESDSLQVKSKSGEVAPLEQWQSEILTLVKLKTVQLFDSASLKRIN